MNLDHVAIEVGDFDARIAVLTATLGMTLRRTGHLVSDPDRRVAMVADPRGVKLELVEGPPGAPDRLLHVAWDAGTPDGVDATLAALRDAGCVGTDGPRRFEPARSRTATVRHASGAVMQVVAYDDDSPDRAAP